VVAALTLPVSAQTSQPPFKLTYDSPASKWTDALPLDNGRSRRDASNCRGVVPQSKEPATVS
jgi:hypothetical protein